MRILFALLLTLTACSKNHKYDPRGVKPGTVPADRPFSYFTVQKTIITPVSPAQSNNIYFFARDNKNIPVTGLDPKLTITPETGAVQTCSMTETATLGTYLCTVTIGEDYKIDITPGSISFVSNRHVADVVVTDNPYCYTNSGLDWTNHKQSGMGTALDPYLICSAAQLKSLAETTTMSDLSLSYKLMVNLDLATFLATAANEFSIGSGATPFTGTFDGNSLRIKNYSLKNDTQSFFASIQSGEVKNLQFTFNNSITNAIGATSGGLIDSINTASSVSLSNLNIEGTFSCAGIADCKLGGVVGSITATGAGQVTATHIKSKITATNAKLIGGVIGEVMALTAPRVIMNKISSQLTLTNTTIASASTDIGGVVGTALGVNLTDAKTIVSILINNGATNVGGVLGRANSVNLKNAFALGDMDLQNVSVNASAGLMGQLESSVTVNDSVALVNQTGLNCTGECGKVIGRQTAPAIISDLYTADQTVFDFDTINSINVNETSIDIQANPTYFFLSSNNPMSSWDFGSIWMSVASDFPILQ